MLKTIAFLILFFGALTLVTIFEGNEEDEEVKGEKEKQNLILGYCNDFIAEAIVLAEQNDIDLVRLPSYVDVLSSLKSGEIDYAFIGRRAYGNQIDEQTLEIPLRKYGWTLVSSEEIFFEYSDIEDLEIHTYLNQEEVENFFAYEPSIVFHEDIDSAIENEIALIHWEDFRDDFQLVVPTQNGNRVEKYRTPILYMLEGTRPLGNLEL